MLTRWSGKHGYWLLSGGLALAFAGAAAAGIAVHSTARAHRMPVTLREYRVTTKRLAASGKTTFVATNRGHLAHSLAISGPGIGKKRIVGVIGPGKTKSLTVTLKRGTYRLWCPVPGHAALGMRTTLRVGAATGGTETTTNSTSTSGGGAVWG
ncbi:MAG TPA: plastocyanin/azurin family copper-binding protein [Gaiellaceae bacterium]